MRRDEKTDVEPDAEMIEYLRRGGLVVTANARAARALERRFTHAQQAIGLRAWSAPEIVTWQVWLEQLWQQHLFNSTESRLLLSSVQERSVWTRVVARDPAAQQVLSPDALASLAQQAYALLGDYRAHDSRSSSWSSSWRTNSAADGSSDAEAFHRWANAFERECRENNWLSCSRLAEELGQRIRNATVTVANEIRTLGFDRLTPAQQHFLDAVKGSGCDVAAYQQSVPGNKCELRAAKDRSSELHECAQWLRARLLANPQEQLAVIVTNPRDIRGELERVFRRVLMPATMYLAMQETEQRSQAESQYATVPVTEAEQPSVFEFSLGVPLASLPLIRAALLLLRWLEHALRHEEVTWLLLSGFLAPPEDLAQMAQLDARIRAKSLLPPDIELGAFLKQGQHAKTAAGSGILRQLDSFAGVAVKSGIPQRQRSAMEWADVVPGMLAASGWPCSQQQSSLRFQALDKWEQLLAQVATLTFDGSRISYREFIKLLEQQASEVIFAPQSLDAPIQIIGALESSGQSFDAIWFMGAEENAWPVQGSPNPLIPMAIQRKFEMPHATAELDWKLAHVATQRIASSAPECVFSHAQQDEDGELRISPLMLDIFGSDPGRLATEPLEALHENVTATVAIEEVEEGAPIPWPRERVAGGATVLTSQSACAFQAFARKRLRAGDLDCAEWGLNALIRGELMHEVLEKLWCGEDGLGSLDGLQTAIAEDELEPLLTQKIAEVFAKHPATHVAEGWIHAYLETEKLRFKDRLSAWLNYENGRQPFSVEACEKEIPDLSVGDLRLSVRVDRIDRLENGQRVLIDYKTSEVSLKKWECPRPEDPQLPLYATFGDLGEISGLLFAQIRAGGDELKGKLSEPQDLMLQNSKGKSRVKLTQKDRDGWRSELLRLADDFLRADATVAPKDYPKTCTYCGLQQLCRVAVTDVPLDASDVDALDEYGLADYE